MTEPTIRAQEMGWQVFAALDKGRPGMAEAVRLVEQGADVNLISKWGKTALLVASARNYQPLVHALLDRGAHPDATGSGGQTPLMEAITHSYLEVAHMLIEAGADITLKNPQGQTAADLALERHNERNARLLEEWSRAVARHRQKKHERAAIDVWADAGLPAQSPIVVRRSLRLKGGPHA